MFSTNYIIFFIKLLLTLDYFNANFIIRFGSLFLSRTLSYEIPSSDCLNAAFPLSRKYVAEVIFREMGGSLRVELEGTFNT